ncbi:primosomal protein DnaI [Vagococcus xieshaowenii]|uniref:Primosomal protein DnaI n=1 Tax=Vagococcus xieshaowenii TaxID=2562451 RepID=A0AAJ5EFY8_9ENTE|nr:primosomal protein DnaI [Vagococcus xieshaowenii]QCA28387.1 primosomal protein DnaI [Vagococcus xieshaowenii]TFZ42857.1 primosomal protein DnaI [Vagococcus xieshaowenii]
MENLGDEMKKVMRHNAWQDRYQHLVDTVMQDKYVQRFLSENEDKITQELVEKSYAKLYEFVQERRKFDEGSPSMIAPGYEPILFLNYRSIDVTYVPTNELLAKQEADAIKRRVKAIDIPKDVRDATFDAFELTDEREHAYSECVDFVNHYIEQPKIFRQGLYLQGSFGVGKTYLLGAMANELAQSGFHTTLIHFPTFAVEIKQAIGNNTLNEKLEEVKKAPILMIDDIGADSMSAWIRDDILGVILQYRMQEQLPTFFSSNFDMEQLEVQHLRQSQRGDDEPLKAKRIMERIKYLSKEIKMIGLNRRLQ